MKELFRPTLVRSVVLALIVGFPLAWVALTAKNLLQLWHQQESDRTNFASSSVGLPLRDALTAVEDPAEARLMMVLEIHPFQSILQNLLDNAVRYGHEGGRIAVELSSRVDALTLSVSDDGSGITPAERSQVFERFYRGAQREGAPGTGLGLTIVKQATARLGGKVLITEGLDGLGCCFRVEIGSHPR